MLDERDRNAHTGPAAGRALDRETAAQTLGPLLHAANAEAGRRVRGDAAPVVAHAEFKLRLVFGQAELDRHFLRLRVANGIGQALLHAAEDGEIDRIAI